MSGGQDEMVSSFVGVTGSGVTTLFGVVQQVDSDEDAEERPHEYYTRGEKRCNDIMVQAPTRNGFTDSVATRSTTEGSLQFGRAVLGSTALSFQGITFACMGC